MNVLTSTAAWLLLDHYVTFKEHPYRTERVKAETGFYHCTEAVCAMGVGAPGRPITVAWAVAEAYNTHHAGDQVPMDSPVERTWALGSKVPTWRLRAVEYLLDTFNEDDNDNEDDDEGDN